MNISINIEGNQGTIQIFSVENDGKAEKTKKKKRKKNKNGCSKKNNKQSSTPPKSEAEAEEREAKPLLLSELENKERTQHIVQEILEEIQDVYTPKKKDNLFLSNIYKQLYFNFGDEFNYYYANKSERMYWCGSLLAFEVNGSEKKLVKANSCHVRLCPLCMWRRSLKCYREMRIIYDYVKQQEPDSKFLSLVLTQKNVSSEKLSMELDAILYAFNKFTKLDKIKTICLGFIRSLEVTYNREADTYHPHIHLLIHTTNGLYRGRNYLSQEKYRKMWSDMLGLEYLPQVRVEKFKAKNPSQEGRELAEMCKYTVKPSNFLFPDDEELSKRVTKVLDNALANRRLLSYGGSLRQVRKKLLFSDEEELQEEDDIAVEDKTDEGYVELYRWHFGDMKYKHLHGEERENILAHIKWGVEE